MLQQSRSHSSIQGRGRAAEFEQFHDEFLGREVCGSSRMTRYRVTRKIAEGGMGTVYHAVDERTGASVAVKRAHLEEEMNAPLRRESAALGRLRHRNIVRLLDSGIFEGRECAVLEYLQGRTLAKAHAEGGITTWGGARSVLVQLCDALGAVHEAGMVHRDVKPENVFLASQPDGSVVVKLLDFGLVKLGAEEDLAEGVIVGTPEFVSPEMVLGLGYDHRSDIYSVGVIMYGLLTHSLPFDVDPSDSFSIMLAHLKHERPILPSARYPQLPKWLEDIVMRAIETDPCRRFQTAKEMGNTIAHARGVIQEAS